MILAKLNQPEFEYDIHSLIKAFFPEENVSATAEDKKYEEEITLQFQVEYEPQQIKIEWKGKNQESHDRSFPVDFSDRTETKNELKQNFYQILSEITGKKLPWGTLTGIRPTKILMKFLEEGKTEAEIRVYMQKTYFASDEKIDLSIDIAERELEILKKIDYENGYSLYIGIPFCPTTCLYCSFTSFPVSRFGDRMRAYLDALFILPISELATESGQLSGCFGKRTGLCCSKIWKKTSEFHLHWRGHTDNIGAISA